MVKWEPHFFTASSNPVETLPLGMSVKILITGASSGLGQNLMARLAAQDSVSVRAMKHRASVALKDCETVEGDLNDPQSLVRSTTGMDTVVHLAAITHTHKESDYFKVNVRGTENLIAACRRNGVRRILFISSAAACAGGGAYAESKIAAEECIKRSGLSWLILRPREVYGEEGGEGIQRLIGWVRNYPIIPVIGDGRYGMSPVHMDDVVNAILQAVLHRDLEGQTLVLAGPEEIAFVDLVDRLCAHFQLQRAKIFLPVRVVLGIAAIGHLLGMDLVTRDQIPRLLCAKSHDNRLAMELLDYRPKSLEAGLEIFLKNEERSHE